MHKHTLALAIAILVGFAPAAAAQQPGAPMQMPCLMAMHGMMMGDGMAHGMMPDQMPMDGMKSPMQGRNDSPGMHGMMNDSSHMARLRSELGLSDAQLQQFHGIIQRACTAAQPHMTLAMQAHQAAMQAVDGDNPNLDHFEDQLDNAAKHMVAAQVEMAKGMIEIRKALSPAQRQKLDEMHKQMMMRRGGMQRGAMPHAGPKK